jgi:hypothetical protein
MDLRRVILSTGLQTPTGVVTEGSHDTSRADYIYESVNAGDRTVEDVRVLDDLEATSSTIERLHGVPHDRSTSSLLLHPMHHDVLQLMTFALGFY